MTEDGLQDDAEAPPPRPRTFPTRVAVVLVVVALFGGVLAAKTLTPGPDASGSVTATRNDATADYEAALQTGKPVYVLFHSLT